MSTDESVEPYREADEFFSNVAPDQPVPPSADATSTRSSTAAEAPPELRFPPHLTDFRLLAQTNLSWTWKAFDTHRQAHVVVKEPRPGLLRDPEVMQRFRREIQLVAQLMHASIVPILTPYLDKPPRFFTMPLIEGAHLDIYCQHRRVGLKDRLRLFRQICDAVVHAHQHGVIHRDLKPANILVDDDGRPHLLDFGLGRVLSSGAPREGLQTDVAFGTPTHMAPEQAAGLPGDTRTDVYALGVILFQLLTGQLPIPPANDLEETRQRVCAQPPEDPQALAPQVGAELSAITLKALRKDPGQRYQSVAELAQDIDNWLHARAVTAVPPRALYLASKWMRRNRGAAAIGCGLAVVCIVFGVALVMSARHAAAQRERGRHEMAVPYGRGLVIEGSPLQAWETLWREYLRYPGTQTRFALWQLYRHHPCLRAVAGPPQYHIASAPSGRWIATLAAEGNERSLLLYDPDTGTVVARQPLPPSAADCLCFSADGELILTGGSDGLLRGWHSPDASGSCQGQIAPAFTRDLQHPISALACSGDTRWLVAGLGGDHGGLVLLECSALAATGPINPSWDQPGAPALACAFSADSQLIACASRHDVTVWNVTGALVARRDADPEGHALAGHGALAFGAGARFLYGAWQDVLRLDLEARAGDVVCVPERKTTWGGRALAVAPDGTCLAVGSGDGTVQFVALSEAADVPRPLPISGFHDADAHPIDVCFVGHAPRVASVTRDGLRLWDLASAARLLPGIACAELQVLGDGESWAATDPQARQLYLCPARGAPSPIWDLGQHAMLGKCAVRADQRFAAGSGQTSGLQWWLEILDVSAGTVARLELAPGEKPEFLTWYEGDTPLLLVCLGIHRAPAGGIAVAGELRGYRQRAGAGWEPLVLHAGPGACNQVAVSRTCGWVAATFDGPVEPRGGVAAVGEIVAWRAPSPRARFPEAYDKCPFRGEPYNWNVAIVGTAAGNALLATTNATKAVTLWDAETGRSVGQLRGHRGTVFECAALADNLLVTSANDGTVRVWDVFEGQELCHLRDEAGAIARISVAGERIGILEDGRPTLVDLGELQRFVANNEPYVRATLDW